jgi:putative Ca2+/H+ antiporter (TMEM165/GDT1 family)
MQSFLVSTSVVGLAEIGDKTQLLSLVLAARYRKPIPIVLGVLAATLINHAASGALGAWLASVLSPNILNWAVVASFAVMAVWILVPDKLDEADSAVTKNTLGVFGTTAVTFFLAEMGDKTQIAALALAAKYASLWQVVAGTTLGMMIVNVPTVIFAERLTRHIPLRAVRLVAAAIYATLGVATLLGYSHLGL